MPARTSHDDRYFTDAHQAMPANGYTRMFENMLDDRNISIVLNTDYRDVAAEVKASASTRWVQVEATS